MTLIRRIATERNEVFAISGDMVTLTRRDGSTETRPNAWGLEALAP